MFRYLSTLFIILAITGCDLSPSALSVAQIQQQGELVVLTRNAPTVYFIDRNGEGAGLDYDLIQAFATHHNLKVRLEIRDTVEEIFDALRSGEGHIAAAGLTQTAERSATLLNSTPYQHVSEQVVCRRGGPQPQNVTELAEASLAVISQSSYAERLKQLTGVHPKLNWQSDDDIDTEGLLEKVWQKEVDCTVADSNIVAVNRRYHPELITTFALTEQEPLVWYMPTNASALQQSVNQWLSQYSQSGDLDILLERYYGFAEIFDYVDTRKYINRISQRLPGYEATFKEAANLHQLPWHLLAAQAYQESHWNPNAKSPTGVRGIMMLTQITAKEVGVSRRLDAKQSIHGGAKYLKKLHDRLSEDITEPDRTWMALAAYNVGMGHMHDARTLAKRLGKNPDSWTDIKETLPLLAKRKYYKTLKYGYARGHEPVQYVTRIRNFEDILLQADGKNAEAE